MAVLRKLGTSLLTNSILRSSLPSSLNFAAACLNHKRDLHSRNQFKTNYTEDNDFKSGFLETDLKPNTLGCSRKKIDVNGISLNWEKAGTGDHVILMLPNVLGT